ncbi:MAG: hypothetical protein M3020_28220, partial [Myxococcota bacterium]|nr:hypothetical protein [Myxococcota bacterium]
TGEGGESGAGDCDGVTPVDGEECEGLATICDVGDEVCACLPAGRGASEWSCTGGVDAPGAGGSGGVFDCDGAAPVDGEDCDGADVICQTDDGGVCACLGQSWSCFGGDTEGAGGAGFGFGGRQGAGGRTGMGGRRSFGQGGV